MEQAKKNETTPKVKTNQLQWTKKSKWKNARKQDHQQQIEVTKKHKPPKESPMAKCNEQCNYYAVLTDEMWDENDQESAKW